jgi:hypothetical protein
MFDTKINKILGNNPLQTGNLIRPEHRRNNFNINPQNVLVQLKQLFDKLPEIKEAKGNLTVNFADGTKKTLQVYYKE